MEFNTFDSPMTVNEMVEALQEMQALGRGSEEVHFQISGDESLPAYFVDVHKIETKDGKHILEDAEAEFNAHFDGVEYKSNGVEKVLIS
jgi:ferric iron reductase protein FhuF